MESAAADPSLRATQDVTTARRGWQWVHECPLTSDRSG